MDEKFVPNRKRLSDALIEFPLAALGALDAAAYKGRIVLADDGNLWHSDGTAWRLNSSGGELSENVITRTDELWLEAFDNQSFPSASENNRRMIYDSTDGVPRISDGTSWNSVVEFSETARHETPPVLVTVGAGGDYATLNAAFEALSNYLLPQGDFDDFVTTEVRILDGTTITSPLILINKDFRWVRITQESGSDVLVSESAFHVFTDAFGGQSRYFMWANRVEIGCVFRLNKSWGGGETQISGTDAYGFIATAGFCVIDGGGFQNFTINVCAAANSFISHYDSVSDDARKWGCWAVTDGSFHFADSVVRGSSHSIYCSTGGDATSNHNSTANDFRRVAGSDSDDDIAVASGGRVALDVNALGGTNQPLNVWTPKGLITQDTGGPLTFDFSGATLTNAVVDGLSNGLVGVVVSTDEDLAPGRSVIADATGGTLELSLPASLAVGNQFVVLAKGGSVRILANGHTIQFNNTDIGGNLLLAAGQTVWLQADTTSSVEIL